MNVTSKPLYYCVTNPTVVLLREELVSLRLAVPDYHQPMPFPSFPSVRLDYKTID